MIEEADVVGDWQRPSFDIAASTVGFFEGDTLLAYAEISGGDRGDAAVHPDHRDRGLATLVGHWLQETARARGEAVIGLPVPQGSHWERALGDLGFRPRWETWVLRLPEGRDIEPQRLPEGYVVREARPDEWPVVHTVIEDVFLEWSVRDRQSYEDFLASVPQRPGFEPWNLRVVLDGHGVIGGAAYVLVDGQGNGYVNRLAVRRDQRNRSLARALLVDAFAVARAHGAATLRRPARRCPA
jgi:mycothiol synthase